ATLEQETLMKRSRSRRVLSLVAGVAASGSMLALWQSAYAGTNGPDIIVGDVADTTTYGVQLGRWAYDLGTVSCNNGTVDVNWSAGNAQHPIIGQNVYRLKNNRFEQVGMSWLKNGFTALTQSLCNTCNGHGGAVLGVGCSDPYTGGLNGSQNRL